MKVYTTNTLSGDRREMHSLEDAVIDSLNPDPYSYEGKLEKLETENEKLREMLARLVECIYGESDNRLNKAEKLKYILGYGYEVEE